MKIKKVLSLAVSFAVVYVMSAVGMDINISSNMDNASGDITVDGAYHSSGTSYGIDVRGYSANNIRMDSDFSKSGSTSDAVNTATKLDFQHKDWGYVNAVERIGTHSGSVDGNGVGTYLDAAAGLGLERSNDASIDTQGASSDNESQSVSYNVNKARGNGGFTIAARANSFNYNPATCSNPATYTNFESYKFKQQSTGVYNYTGRFNIHK